MTPTYYDDTSAVLSDFDEIKLTVASPQRILDLSNGEVTKSETINYRTNKPEKDGLFCEKIFGPTKNISQHDPRFKGVRARDMAVDKKGRLVTNSNSRRERMAHIKLEVPAVHTWFLRSNPSAISNLLGMSAKSLERVIYFSAYMINEVDEEKKASLYSDLDAAVDTEKKAIEARYEELSNAEGADVKELAKARSKETDAVNAAFLERKSQLDALKESSLITEADFGQMPQEYKDVVKVSMGAEAIYEALKELDLEKLIEDLRTEVEEASGQKYKKLIKRLKIVEGIHKAGIDPSWMCLTVVPVIPPELRPMVSLSGGRFATSDLNDLYRRVINRNNRLKKLTALGAPELIKRNEKRMLQEAVDALIDNAGRGSRAVTATGGRRKLKSLTDVLKGKQGRLRGNLLGKRVDYSGRSVIVSGPELELDECGLPRAMALELFKAHVIGWLIENEYAQNIKGANRLIELRDAVIWDALDAVMEGKYVLLNRAPTLHRLSVLAFKPKLNNGRAIQLHPLVCAGFNADFDGDQMAVHLPLSDEAQREAREIMAANLNLLKPADGSPILHLSQDIVLGCYFLTYIRPEFEEDENYKSPVIGSMQEAEAAYKRGQLSLQQPIITIYDGKKIETTYGRLIFNATMPEGIDFQNKPMDSSSLKAVMAIAFEKFGPAGAAKVANDLKELGFAWATISGLSTGMDDYADIKNLPELLKEGEDKVAEVAEQHKQGLLTDEEKRRATVEAWKAVDRKISAAIQEQFKRIDSGMEMAAVSGARGSIGQFKNVAGMKGIVVDAVGREIELPIRSNYKTGFNPVEYFIDSSAARKGLIDTALKTADAGYLTRRMVDIAQDIYTVNGEAEDPGFTVYKTEAEETGIKFADRLHGRFAAKDVKSHVKAGELISKEVAEAIEKDDSISEVTIMSVLTCSNLRGVDVKSYGVDLATGQVVEPHQAVGVIAAQSLGENTTQLTLDTKHQAGSATESDVTKGLPRVDELLEARIPKGKATIAELDGVVSVWEDGETQVIQITPSEARKEEFKLEDRQARVASGSDVLAGDVLASTDENAKQIVATFAGKVEVTPEAVIVTASQKATTKYTLSKNTQLTVSDGDKVQAGDQLTEGSLDPNEILEYKGVEAAQRYIINQVLALYASQGIDINAKHLELVVRQMFSRVRVEDPGDSLYAAGEVISRASAIEENDVLTKEGKKPIVYSQLLLGLTRASIASDSFLSAASFQETTRVLVGAAITGKTDKLRGLKENVIIGRKIPVGTGARNKNGGLLSDDQ
ncbi:MAG: DNA-directed RNA polymerase subunit beta' [Candidatus Nomurabacteria bacterium]|nr:MAG: DNA-directed RNA polymerase subunit beta' [Candidatus Nomurabacteria bacterium]